MLLPDPATLSLMVLAGMLITLSPCILPVLPLMASSGLAKSPTAPLQTGLGLAVGFALMGLLLAGIGQSIGLSEHVTRPLFATLFLLFGLLLALPVLDKKAGGWLQPIAAVGEKMANATANKKGGAFWLGLALGGIWSPCAGPLLAGALGLASQSEGVLAAGIRMFAFGIGAALPLIVIAYALKGSARRFLPKLASGGAAARRVLGLVMAAVGLAVLTGLDEALLRYATNNLGTGWLNFITQL